MTRGRRLRGDAPSRILVDGYNLALPQGTGVATYARNLVQAIADLGAAPEGLYGLTTPRRADPLLEEIALVDPPPRKRAFNTLRIVGRMGATALAGGAVDAHEVVRTGRVAHDDRTPAFARVWTVPRLFLFASRWFAATGRPLRVRLPGPPPAVMHWTYPLPIQLEGARNVYTLHDLVPLRLPLTTLDNKDRYLRLMRLLARRADHIVTVSEASRRDIIDVLGVAAERVTNTYQSVALADAPDAEAARALTAGALGLEPQGFHLFFGAIEPKKNVGRLLEAYLLSGVRRPLVLVGKRAWMSDAELQLMEAQRAGGGAVTGRIVHLDYAPAALLRALVRCARSVVFPSLYEGFGLPVLEALALGAPVITSTTASLPEVAGEAAVLVDPYAVRAIADALRRLDGDDALRAELSAKGPAQAARFSPAAHAERLAPIYRALGAAV